MTLNDHILVLGRSCDSEADEREGGVDGIYPLVNGWATDGKHF
jgi:hypothetical protein